MSHSADAIFACMDCKVYFSLGKAFYRSMGIFNLVAYFHSGQEGDLPHSQSIYNTVLWKMLADHAGHCLNVLTGDDTSYKNLLNDPASRKIGGSGPCALSFEAYLRDWPGLQPLASSTTLWPSSPSHEIVRLPYSSFFAFEHTLQRAALQLSSQQQGLITLLVPDPIPVSIWLPRFLQRRRPASLDRYHRLSLRILHETYAPLYEGPILTPPETTSFPQEALLPSRYAHLFCPLCYKMLFLGQVFPPEQKQLLFFLHGKDPSQPNHKQHQLSRALWKMLADHTDHDLFVVLEGSWHYERHLADEWICEIGGDGPRDTPFEDYLQDWPG
ncbi:MAG: hypothetical protein IRZ24_18800 [Thermogemmatispora sp.]|uniref:hypothetical protein n=1 Tax=Thermogemmatispora sp. TaxID=1968838 RepID=UPI001D68F1FA|nr:hypothetical protein [Thermogemmatispora sp.]MBX5452120.1 hypothetical protein [Thermogemmatispora sp.]